MDGFERRKERKKESIRRAAIELFGTYGFEKVSIGDIARQARVSHVTIYNHFGSKEELVREIVKTAISDLVEKARSIIKGDRPFLEKLELIVLDKAEVASRYQGELMRMAVRDNPEMQRFVESLWKSEIERLLVELVEEGKRLSYISGEVSPEAILYYFEIIRNGAFASSEMLAKIKPDARLARELNHLFLYGLVDRKEP
jgi:AcrR family transcriptional regulator